MWDENNISHFYSYGVSDCLLGFFDEIARKLLTTSRLNNVSNSHDLDAFWFDKKYSPPVISMQIFDRDSSEKHCRDRFRDASKSTTVNCLVWQFHPSCSIFKLSSPAKRCSSRRFPCINSLRQRHHFGRMSLNKKTSSTALWHISDAANIPKKANTTDFYEQRRWTLLRIIKFHFCRRHQQLNDKIVRWSINFSLPPLLCVCVSEVSFSLIRI